MKNCAKKTLSYTGTVTLSRYKGSKKIPIAVMHNSGCNPLFNFLADCLAFDFKLAEIDRPAKIMLLDAQPNPNGGYDILSSQSEYILLNSKPEKIKSTNAGIVRYSFILPRDLITTTSFNCIGLYTSSAKENTSDYQSPAAICEVNIPIRNLKVSSIIVLDWQLSITNS